MYTALELSADVLNKVGRPLTTEEIWDYAVEFGLNEECGLKGKTPWNTIGARIYVNIKDFGEQSRFYIASKGPTRFFLTGNNKSTPVNMTYDEVPLRRSESKYKELDLHPLLVYYLITNPHFHSHSKTINANAAKKGGSKQNEWRYPDIVSVYYPFDEYSNEETYIFFENIKQPTVKIYSFEIKKEITTSNVRMYYFQAISNSSWANEGYLVAAKIESEAKEELRRLNRSFGIGVIQLDLENVSDSEILFPSRYNTSLDDDMVDILSDNRDFLSFITRINKNIRARDVYETEYDRVLSEEELSEKLAKMTER